MTPDAAPTTRDMPVVEVDNVVTRFGPQVVHDGVSFRIGRGTLTALIGGSGTGKSVLLREIIGLQRPTAGNIRVFGTDMWNAAEAQTAAVRRRFGMMFQDGALFSALTVAQNIRVPLLEHANIPGDLLHPLIELRLAQAGLTPDTGNKLPSQLSGGMRKRAAIARALALEPEILFLDEPTSGLDPATARSLDALVRSLVDDLGISVLVVTHDLDTLLTVVDRIIVLADGHVLADGPAAEVTAIDHPWIRSYFAIRTMTGTQSR
ncbi:MAG: ATP-binding cassette domain-containing protein [Pseudomonadales bacterium]|nr:ATP-binding cassette domain-containing protein [Pseudomonadales bacterium]MCP5185628.1 ATP-binding cassette domain-containing protein [Pseudomonadales bacterium]